MAIILVAKLASILKHSCCSMTKVCQRNTTEISQKQLSPQKLNLQRAVVGQRDVKKLTNLILATCGCCAAVEYIKFIEKTKKLNGKICTTWVFEIRLKTKSRAFTFFISL